MEKEQLITLLEKYQLGTLSADEQAKLETWYVHYAKNSQLEADPEIMQERLRQIAVNLPLQRNTSTIRKLRPYLSVAAALLIIGFGLLFIVRKEGLAPRRTDKTAILPGHNQATLTLVDGTKIDLDSTQSTIIISNEDIKYQNGESIQNVSLSREHSKSTREEELSKSGDIIQQLQLSTPRGGQYQVILEDGTKVMLNSFSTLKYPSHFSGNARVVEINGEGFFDVAHVKDKSFTVKTKHHEIDVVGTSFNVNAYPNESIERTTLITGKAKIRAIDLQRRTYSAQLLTPNKQATIKDNKLTVNSIDVNHEIAWTKGYFSFDRNTLNQVLTQLSRWYSIDSVSYSEPALKQELFSGTINRYEQMSQILKKLSLTGAVQFEEKGKTITVKRGTL